MILVNFWLPPQSREKIFLCGCTALITSLFLLFFCYKIPPLSDRTPLIGKKKTKILILKNGNKFIWIFFSVNFYSGCLYQISISLVISVVVINLSRRPHCQPLPRVFKKMIMGWPGKYLGLSDFIQAVSHLIYFILFFIPNSFYFVIILIFFADAVPTTKYRARTH